jgi:hypothetical protein
MRTVLDPAELERTFDAHEGGAGYIPKRVAIQDCSFLFGILLLSALSYVGRLGFYADDWVAWALFYGAKVQSLGALLRTMLPLHWYPGRPVQMLYLTFAYASFGLHPLPYHLTNTLVLAGTAVLFYATLRELQLPHCLTLTVPLVYELLPHFATDRFWIGAHQAVFSQAFFFLGLYAALRAVRAGRVCALCLKTVSILSFCLALLSYEVIIGLLPVSLLLIGYHMYTKRCGNGDKPYALIFPGLGYLLIAGACLGLTLLYKVQASARATFQQPSHMLIGDRVGEVVVKTIKFNMFRYGAELPRTTFRLYRFSGAGGWPAIIAGIIAISVLLYLNWTLRRSQSALLTKNGTLYLFAAGFVVFVLDCVPLAMLRSQLFFTIDGTSNRVMIAAATGTACVLVGGTMLLILAVVPTKLQSLSFCSAIAVICMMNYVCIASFAECWVKAYIEQREIVLEVRKNVDLAPGSTLLIDGFCRYSGRRPCSSFFFDASDELQIAYRDETLSADVVSPNLEISDDAIRTTVFGNQVSRYVYGKKLWLHNVQRKSTIQLIDSLVARNYFRTMNPDKNSGCPVGTANLGSPIPGLGQWR